MKFSDVSLELKSRSELGTGSSKALRNKGLIPGIIYGRDFGSHACVVEESELKTAIKTKTFFSKFLKTTFEGKEVILLPKVIQVHPVKNNIEHVDFNVVTANRPITMKVSIKFINKELCRAIKLGGVLNLVCGVVELVGAPANMPEFLTFDLENSEVGDSINIDNFALPEGVSVRRNFQGRVVATVLAAKKKKDEAEETSEEEGAEAAAK